MNWSRTHRWKLTEWHPWVFKGAAVVHVAALALMGAFLSGTFRGTQMERMVYIAEHETAVFWSWASWMFRWTMKTMRCSPRSRPPSSAS